MFKLYKQSQAAQLNWIRSHPVQYLALNATLFVVFIGYIEIKERLDARKLENEIAQQEK
jgi:hypothetical protein